MAEGGTEEGAEGGEEGVVSAPISHPVSARSLGDGLAPRRAAPTSQPLLVPAAAMAVMWEDPGVQACQGLEISERRPAGVPGVDVPVRQRRKASANLKTQWPTLGTL